MYAFLDLYFHKKLTVTQISKNVSLSVGQVSRILSAYPLYKEEKATRKEDNRKRHIENTKEYIKNKRLEEKAKMDYMHNQAIG